MWYRFFKIIIGFTLLVGVYLYINYFINEKLKHEYFIYNVKSDFILLKLLDNNRTEAAKALLTGGVNSVFVEMLKEKNNFNKYTVLCKDFTQSNLELIKRFDLNISDENVRSTFDSKQLEAEIEFRKTREDFIRYCESQKEN